MTVLSPDTLTYGEIPSLDPGPEWPSLLVDFAGPARDGELCVKWAKEAKTAGTWSTSCAGPSTSPKCIRPRRPTPLPNAVAAALHA